MGLFDTIANPGNIFGDSGGPLGDMTGIGAKNFDPHNLDDAGYEDYYNKAINGINNSGASTNAAGVQNALNGQLAGLDDNMAGRKKAFGEDMSRSFGNNIQQKGRAAGGTGNLAQTLSPQGGMYDSEARQTARGYNDLYSQGTKDLSTLSGVQRSLNDEEFQRSSKAADLNMNRINQRMGVASQNAENTFNAEQLDRQRRMGGINAVGKLFGMGMMSGGGGGGSGAGGGSGGSSSGGGAAASGFSNGGPVLNGEKYAKGRKVVPGRAKVKGDSPENDTVNAKLSPGEGIIPRSVMNSEDPVGDGSEFIKDMVAKRDRGGLPKKNHYDDGGMFSSIAKLAPLAMMLLNKGGQVPKKSSGGDLHEAASAMLKRMG